MDIWTSLFRPVADARQRRTLGVIALAYFLAYELASLFPDSAHVLVAVWPAGGIALAALLLNPRSLWPSLLSVIFITGVLAHLLSGRSFVTGMGYMTANVLETGLSAWLITRLCGPRITFTRVNEIVALILAATVVNADTAFVGAGTAMLAGGKPYWGFYKSWWIADALGILLVTPLIVLWRQKLTAWTTATWKRRLEFPALLSIASAGAWFIFGPRPARFPITPHPYMLCVVMLWMALRFGPRTATTTLALVGTITITITALGWGSFPLGGTTQTERLLMVQTFLGVIGSVGLLLAASQTQRRESENLLRQSEARLRTIADNLPNSILYQVRREHDGSMQFLHFSANVERFLGCPGAATLKNAALVYDRVVAEDQPIIQAARAASLRTMSVFQATVRMRDAQDKLHWVQLCASPRQEPDGRMVWDGICTDVTELKEARQALTASEALLQQFIKYAPAAVAMFDNDLRYLQASDRWLTDYHLSGQNIIGKSHYEVFPDIPQRWKEIHQRALAGATESCEQDPFPRADGSLEWLQWEIRPWFKPDGTIGGVIMFTQVITERRRMEDALRLNENRLRSAMQYSPIGMGLVALDGDWLEVNPALCRIVGYTADELIGRNFQVIGHPDDRENELNFTNDLLTGRLENYQTEQRYRHKNGDVVWSQLNVSLVRNPDGSPRHFVFQIQNITERKRHMFELITANTRYARHEAALTTLTRSYVPDPGALTAVLQKFTEVVAKALDVQRVSVWRYNASRNAIVCDVLYEAAADFYSSGTELAAASAPSYFRALADAEVIVAHDVEQDARTQELHDNYLRPLGISSMLDVPIHSQGKAIGVLCCEHVGAKRHWKPDEQTFAIAVANLVSMQLIQTERQELEEQFRQAQKLEALGTLAGGIAHDFNNILAAIISFAELAKMDNPANRELHDNLDQILKAGNRATSLVRQILWFSRQQKQTRRNLQLRSVLTEALGLIRATLPATIEIEQRVTDPLPDVFADASQLHQVIMNLCANAAHAMRGRHGQLRVELDTATLDDSSISPNLALPPGGYVRLTISDTGHGMNEATRKRIFEPFFTTKAPGEGTGLGLAVVHGIIKSHEGDITVQSTPGLGTSFTILLPAVPVIASPHAPNKHVIPTGNGERILFVDDEPDLCEAASRMIDRLGYVPVTFNSSEEAWKEIQTKPDAYDLMVSDLTMPVLTGPDLARNVLELRPQFPIIMTTGYAGDMTEEFLRELGIRELVAKPLDFHSLAHAINRALQDATPAATPSQAS
jgi:PAS domain S-box-containing protein